MAIDVVTGATGLIGGNLVRALLDRGRRVRVLVRKSSNTTYLRGLPDVEFVVGDVTDYASLLAAFQGVEHVYHCAGVVSLWSGLADEMWRVNVEGTRTVITAAVSASVGRLIHCSTVDALGLPETDVPSTEETGWNWDRLGLENPYARTKYEAQKLALEAAGTLDVVVVNPTYVFGPYDLHPSSGRMICLIATGKLLVYPAGGDNFVAVQDVTRAMVTAASKGTSGECYILGHENTTYQDIFTRIATVLGVTPPGFTLPYGVSRLGGLIGDIWGSVRGREQTINSDTVRMGYIKHYYSAEKAVRTLGMEQTPVDDAIESAVRWFYDMGMLRTR